MTATQKLFNEIPNMKEVEFIGLARLLGVRLIEEVETEEKYVAKDFVNVLNEVMQAFDKLNRQKKREILKLVKVSNSQKIEEDDNADNIT